MKQFIFLLIVLGMNAYASDSESEFTLDIGGGPATYKSTLVESNDTSFVTAYCLQVSSVTPYRIQGLLNSELTTTNFSYADSNVKSKIVSSFQDTIFRTFLGPSYLGIVFSRASFNVTKQDQPYLNSMAQGYGANAGLVFELSKNNAIFLDILTASLPTLVDSVQDIKTVKIAMGSRTDIFIGGVIRLTKSLFRLVIGYKQRTFSIDAGAGPKLEEQSATWIGLSINI